MLGDSVRQSHGHDTAEAYEKIAILPFVDSGSDRARTHDGGFRADNCAGTLLCVARLGSDIRRQVAVYHLIELRKRCGIGSRNGARLGKKAGEREDVLARRVAPLQWTGDWKPNGMAPP